MPRLKDHQWEAFANALARGSKQRDALLKAGYQPKSKSSLDSVSCRLAKKPEISARVTEIARELLQSKKENLTAITKAWVINRLCEIADLAQEKEQYNVARQCITDIGKGLGYLVEKNTTEWTWDGSISSLSDAQMERLKFQLECIAYGTEEAQLRANKRKAAPMVIDVAPAQIEEPEALGLDF